MKFVSSSNVSISLSDFISGCQVELDDIKPCSSNQDNTVHLFSSVLNNCNDSVSSDS